MPRKQHVKKKKKECMDLCNDNITDAIKHQQADHRQCLWRIFNAVYDNDE